MPCTAVSTSPTVSKGTYKEGSAVIPIPILWVRKLRDGKAFTNSNNCTLGLNSSVPNSRASFSSCSYNVFGLIWQTVDSFREAEYEPEEPNVRLQ